jgi:glycine cleavage system H protein
MADYRGFRVPDDRYYDLDYHVWAMPDGDTVLVGATDPAQAYAGEIIHMTVKKVGTALPRGAILATVESAKYMGPMRCPVSGTVADVNAEATRTPTRINADAYGTWVARVRPDKLAAELSLLTSGADAAAKYQSIIDAWGIQAPNRA